MARSNKKKAPKSWLDEAFDQMVRALNAMHSIPKAQREGSGRLPYCPQNVEWLWLFWAEAARRIKVESRSEMSQQRQDPFEGVVIWVDELLRDWSEGEELVRARLSPSRRVVCRFKDPHMQVAWSVARCLEAALATRNPRRTLRRLGRCPYCSTFFHDVTAASGKQRQVYCSGHCKSEERRVQLRENARASRKRSNERLKSLGLTAPPGKCVTLLESCDRQLYWQRVRFLEQQYQLAEARAMGVVEDEMEKNERKHQKRPPRRGMKVTSLWELLLDKQKRRVS